MQSSDRADVRQLSAWLSDAVARGATEIELHLPRSRAPSGTWKTTDDTKPLARTIVESARCELGQLPGQRMISAYANEPPQLVDVPNSVRTVLIVATAPSGLATLRLDIAADVPEPVVDPAEVLLEVLRRLAVSANVDTSPNRALLERLFDILLASDGRLQDLAGQLEAHETNSLADLLRKVS